MKKLFALFLIGLLSLSTLTACTVKINDKTVFEATDEDVESLKETGKKAADTVKDVVTDEEVQETIKDAASSIKDAATK